MFVQLCRQGIGKSLSPGGVAVFHHNHQVVPGAESLDQLVRYEDEVLVAGHQVAAVSPEAQMVVGVVNRENGQKQGDHNDPPSPPVQRSHQGLAEAGQIILASHDILLGTVCGQLGAGAYKQRSTPPLRG